MAVQLIDLKAQYESIRGDVDAAIRRVLDSAHFILGPEVKAFEKEVASHLDVKHAIGVANGTDALMLALEACGIGPGDEVIVPAFTFFATSEVVSRLGARPVFVDVDPRTYNIDPALVERAVTPRTRAIMPVHLFGQAADMNAILEIARRHELVVIEDNAQAFGASTKVGGAEKKTGTIGRAAGVSYFPSKNLGGMGDGGMVLTDDPAVAERVSMLRSHGWKKKYEPEIIGVNSRLDELQAAILRVKLGHIAKWNARRGQLASLYLKHLEGTPTLTLPLTAPGNSHVYHMFMVGTPQRDTLCKALDAEKIAWALYYPLPLHQTVVYKRMHRDGEFPVSERLARELVALPMYPELGEDSVAQIAGVVKKALS